MASEINITTNRQPTNVNLVIETRQKCKVRVVAFDKVQPLVVFYERVFDVEGVEEMNIKMPQSRKDVVVKVECSAGQDAVRIVKFKKSRLIQYPACFKGKKVHEFIRFAQQISERLPFINCGVYTSLNGKYTIEIYNTIEGTDTPARIHNGEGYIQIAQSKMAKNTVPMNMAILLHEFSHFFVNEELQDEIEADMNGLRMYLGLNYPDMEGHKSFVEVFEYADTPQNRERHDYIFKFIENFQKLKHKTCL